MTIFDQIVECLDQLRRRAQEHLSAERPKTHTKFMVTCESALENAEDGIAMEVVVVIRSKKSGKVVCQEVVTRTDGPDFFNVCVGTLNSLDAELKEWRVSTAKKFLTEALQQVRESQANAAPKKMLAPSPGDDIRPRGASSFSDDTMLIWYDDYGMPHEIPLPYGCYVSFAKESECSKPN